MKYMRRRAVVLEVQKREQQRRGAEKRDGERCGDAPPEPLPLHGEAGRREELADDCELVKELATHEPEKLDPIEPVRRDLMIDFDVALPAQEMPDLGPAVERAGEADRRVHARAVD